MNPTALDILEKNGVKIFGAHQERLLAANVFDHLKELFPEK